MKPAMRTLLPFVALLLAAGTAAVAEEADLGSVDFANSGDLAAQDEFVRAILLLHSFEYEDAEEAFQQAQEADPDFAMAIWGEAMTHNHPLWGDQDRNQALEVMAKLGGTPEERAARIPTDRERGYFEALEILYGEGSKAERDVAYSRAMARLHERYPEDLEAAAFYSLSILGSVPKRDFRTYMHAGSVAEEVFAQNPRHPGAVHYMIHSYDDPIHATLGLRAARVYAQIAPAATHAQHMISHIYSALGRWDEVIAANRKSFDVSVERLRRKGLNEHRGSKHALSWLEYGYLQEGRLDEAWETMEIMSVDAEADPEQGQLWHYAQMRAAMIVADPGAERVPPARELPDVPLGAVAADALATGLRAVTVGEIGVAKEALASLRSAIESAEIAAQKEGKDAYQGASYERDMEVAGILEMELEALVRWSAGKRDRALEIMKEATVAEEARALEYGPPAVVKPTHELTGEMLLAMDRPEEAAEMFAAALLRAPRRTSSLVGVARAAEASDDPAVAAEAWATVRSFWQGEEESLTRITGPAAPDTTTRR